LKAAEHNAVLKIPTSVVCYFTKANFIEPNVGLRMVAEHVLQIKLTTKPSILGLASLQMSVLAAVKIFLLSISCNLHSQKVLNSREINSVPKRHF
jgi:hypothetical protein